MQALWLLCSIATAGQVTVNQHGSTLHWETDMVPFQVNPEGNHGLDPDEVTAAVIEAAEQWNTIEGSWLEIVYEGDTDATSHGSADGAHAVFFNDDWTENPDLLALTYTYSYEDGSITHFDIAINTDGHEWTTKADPQKNDLLNALVHEFGHAVGLDHSQDTEASMFSQTSIGETLKRDLAEDDVLTFASLYDGHYPYPETTAGCSTTGGGSDDSLFISPSAGGGAYPSFDNSAGCAAVGGGGAGHGIALLAGLLIAFRRRNGER